MKNQIHMSRLSAWSVCVMMLLLSPVAPNVLVRSFTIPNSYSCQRHLRSQGRDLSTRGQSLSAFPRIRPGHQALTLRGGAKPVKTKHSEEDEGYTFRQRGMSVSLAMTYFTVMGAKCALPAVLSLITSPSTGLSYPVTEGVQPQQLIARVITLATMAIALGKLLLGPLIDRCGGVRSLQISLSALGVLLGLISSCQSFQIFAVAWVFVDFIFSSCWAACINAIHQSFPEPAWAAQIGTLASAARTAMRLPLPCLLGFCTYFSLECVKLGDQSLRLRVLYKFYPCSC